MTNNDRNVFSCVIEEKNMKFNKIMLIIASFILFPFLALGHEASPEKVSNVDIQQQSVVLNPQSDIQSQAKNTSVVTVSYNDPRDPIEGFNRAMWNFNYEFMDRYFYRPVAHGYRDYVPFPVKTGVNNFITNLNEPSSFVNNTLQGKWGWAANAGGRFTINTTLGLLGIIDVADMMGLPRKQDSFNEVLGYYGVPNGPYFMAPFVGPYVTRELASDWVDNLYFPFSEFTFWQALVKWGLESLHKRAEVIDQERLIDNALDPYTFVKEAYFQHMDYKVYDGDVPVDLDEDELLDEYLEELD